MKPETEWHSKELSYQHGCKEKELLARQQFCNQERGSGLDQKEEQEDLCTSPEEERLVPKQGLETFMWTSACEESYYSDDQTRDLSLDENHSFYQDNFQDHKGGSHEDSRSNAESQPKRPNKSTTLKIHISTYSGKECSKYEANENTFTYMSNVDVPKTVAKRVETCNIINKKHISTRNTEQ